MTLEWEDLDCYVDYDTSPEVWVNFTVWREMHISGNNPTKEVIISGQLKWDGCCNFNFNPERKAMIHTCSRLDLEMIGSMLTRLYDTLGPKNRYWEGD